MTANTANPIKIPIIMGPLLSGLMVFGGGHEGGLPEAMVAFGSLPYSTMSSVDQQIGSSGAKTNLL